jgi:uncharacterized protein
MANPVVHFEVIGEDGPKLQKFYGDVFAWKVDANNPMNYGMVSASEHGIGGGISAGEPQGRGVTFYVEVPRGSQPGDDAVNRGGPGWKDGNAADGRAGRPPAGTVPGSGRQPDRSDPGGQHTAAGVADPLPTEQTLQVVRVGDRTSRSPAQLAGGFRVPN